MGVPLLLTWLRRRFSACFLPAEYSGSSGSDSSCQVSEADETSRDVREADNVYVDLNSLLYQAAALVSAAHGGSAHFASLDDVDTAVLARLCDLLDDVLLRLLRPRALVYLAVDGVSPLGKMAQQRARRRRARVGGAAQQATSSLQQQQQATSNTDSRRALYTMEQLWDSNCISVGTPFMSKTVTVLHQYAVSRTERVNTQRCRAAAAAGDAAAQPLAIVVDDVLRPGEGENKIIEVIRRLRAQDDYNVNTSHIICSSDTDVVVSVLTLHEPRMHILRYEPPPCMSSNNNSNSNSNAMTFARRRAYNNNDNNNDRDGKDTTSSQAATALVDSWRCTFFSIHLFRERLRALLFGTPAAVDNNNNNEDKDSRVVVDVMSADSERFERSLHDVVFVLLLFGNDFLPTIGGSVHDGGLDALLQLLASDFVPRGRVVVDAHTHHIDVTAARYLLSRLVEMRGDDAAGGGGAGVLRVYDGSSSSDDATAAWGFDKVANDNSDNSNSTKDKDSAAVAEARARARARAARRQCYCYWTMLQWALQYSAGVVEHWSCYYPYTTAPTVGLLSTHCGLLSYDALVRVAAARRQRRSTTTASAQGGSDTTKPCDDDDDDDDDADDDDDGDSATAPAIDNRPADAMTQLLVLLPPRSAARLLPSVLSARYDEVAALVQAPVEQLDLAAIDRWCASLHALLSEHDRTRFDAYRVFARDTTLTAASSTTTTTTTTTNGDDDGVRASMAACDATFIAYWPAHVWQAAVDETGSSTRQHAATAATTTATTTAATRTTTAATTLQFFASRPAPQTLRAAAAALLSLPSLPAASCAAPHADARDAHAPSAQSVTTAAAAMHADDEASRLPCRVRDARGCYAFCVAPCALLLRDTRVARAMGVVAGGCFVTDMRDGGDGTAATTTTASSSSLSLLPQRTPLSRDARTQRVRLQWALAAAPRASTTTMKATALLLPSVQLPVQRTYSERVAAQRRVLAEQQQQQQQAQPLALKRPRAHDDDDDE